jgi:hypothetical protein
MGAQRDPWKMDPWKPDDSGPLHDGEYAESEARTNDPVVNPEALQPFSRRKRRAACQYQERAQSCYFHVPSDAFEPFATVHT